MFKIYIPISKTFDYKNGQKSKAVLFLILKNDFHLINTLSNLLTFYFIKPMNVSGYGSQDTCHVFIVWQFTAPYVGYLSKSKKNFRWMSNIKSLSLPHSKPNIEKLYRALWFLVWILTIVMANQAVFVAPILLEEHPAETFFKLIVHLKGRWLWVKTKNNPNSTVVGVFWIGFVNRIVFVLVLVAD